MSKFQDETRLIGEWEVGRFERHEPRETLRCECCGIKQHFEHFSVEALPEVICEECEAEAKLYYADLQEELPCDSQYQY